MICVWGNNIYGMNHMLWYPGIVNSSMSETFFVLSQERCQVVYQIRIIFLMKSAFLILVNNTWKWNEIWNLGNSLHPHKFWHIFTKVFNKLASTFHLLPGLLPFIYLTTQFLPKAGKMKTCCFHYLRCPILKPCLINGSGRCAKFIYTSPHLWKQIFVVKKRWKGYRQLLQH